MIRELASLSSSFYSQCSWKINFIAIKLVHSVSMTFYLDIKIILFNYRAVVTQIN